MAWDKDKIRLLVVDEQEGFGELINEYADICSHLFQIECASVQTGKEALELMRSFEPSVILINAHIPDMNSFEIVDRCRDGLTHVIVTSDNVSADIEETALIRGAQGYMVKSDDPDDVEILLHQVASLSHYGDSTH